jgi:hypothetical protein
MQLADDIEVHFNRMGLAGATLCVVAIGTDVYGSTAMDPATALYRVARKASDDLASRGRTVEANAFVERGMGHLLRGRR